VSFDPQDQQGVNARRRRRLRRRQAVGPWWRRISWIRTGAVVFCLTIWTLVARACMAAF